MDMNDGTLGALGAHWRGASRREQEIVARDALTDWSDFVRVVLT